MLSENDLVELSNILDVSDVTYMDVSYVVYLLAKRLKNLEEKLTLLEDYNND